MNHTSWEEFEQSLLTWHNSRVQKAVVREGVVGFELFSQHGKTWLSMSSRPLHLAYMRPRSEKDQVRPGGLQGLLRKHLKKSRLVETRRVAASMHFIFHTGPATETKIWTLILEFTKGDPRLVLLQGQKIIHASSLRSKDERDLRRGQVYAPPADSSPLPFPKNDAQTQTKSSALSQQISSERKRIKRLIKNMQNDLVKHGDPARWSKMGEAFKGVMHQSKRGDKKIEAFGVTVMLDDKLTPQQNLERFFKKKKRAERGIERCKPRIAEEQQRLQALEEIALISDKDDKQERFAAYRAALPSTGAGIRRRRASEALSAKKRVPYRSFKNELGDVIRVGRSAKDSDALTFHVAKANDFWLHAKDVKGSHVIVSCAKNARPNAKTLDDAALLAAWFSARRSEARVDVQIARRKQVRKPGKGAPAGFVFVHKEEVRSVTMNAKRIAELTRREL